MFCTLLFNHQYKKLYNTLAQYIGLSHVVLLEILWCKICIADKTVHSTLEQLAGMLVLFMVPVVPCLVNYSKAATT
jgi:hypothetical protein